MEVEGFIEVAGRKTNIMVIGIAAADTQFLLLSDIHEVMSVGFITSEGEVIWKFGKPNEPFIVQIESALREKFGTE